jgi:hypothetical protein
MSKDNAEATHRLRRISQIVENAAGDYLPKTEKPVARGNSRWR